VDDECDPRLVLRRLLDDLIELFDLPEWPIAELLLQRAVVMLVDRISPRSLGASVSPAAATITAERATAMLSVQLLGSILPRLQVSRAYAHENVLRLPGPCAAPTLAMAGSIGPSDSQEDAVCLCGRGAITGTWMLDCDRCHRWFHGSCVGHVRGATASFLGVR